MMLLCLFRKVFLAVSLITVLTACGGGGGNSTDNGGNGGTPSDSDNSDTTVTLNATFTKGVVNGGQCLLFSISEAGVISASAIATATTDSSGVASFADVSLSGPALVECSGGTYVDEATGETRVPSTLRAVIDTASNTAPVISPLTEMSVLQAEQDSGGILTAISTYNSANSIGIDATAVVPTDLQSTVADDDAAGDYAIFLAIVSQLADAQGADTPDELDDLINGLASGTISDEDIDSAINDLAVSDSTAASNISADLLGAVEVGLDLVVNAPGTVFIQGSAVEGQVLTASLQDPNGTGSASIGYQWLADTVAIPSATAQSYLLTGGEVGARISVTLTYTDDDGFAEVVNSQATAAVAEASNGGGSGESDLGWGSDDSVPEINCDTVVNSLSALEDAVSNNMAAGTTVCLADGNYTGTLELDYGGTGTLENPITVAAQNPGSAVISGSTSVQMAGEYVVLQGLVFHGGESENSDLIQTRTSTTEWCHYCRITEISIVDLGDANSDSGKWVNVYGAYNRIDHNWFAGKANEGALLIINREADDDNPAATEIDYAQVDYNYFGDRPPIDGKAYADSSDNGFEAIRTGTSDSHAYDSFSVFENNYFERIDAEVEVISNKAGNNRITNNTIRDSFGSITLRHGSSAVVTNNFILGDGHPFAAGIRIIDDGHRVVNNYIEGARYLNTRFHGAMVVHNGNGSTSNGYQNVENVLIAHNTIVDSVNSLNFHGGNESTSPTDIYVTNNIIDNAVGHLIDEADEGLPPNSTYAGNYYEASVFSDDSGLTSAAGFIERDAQLIAGDDGLFRPDSVNGPDLSAVVTDIGDFSPIVDDMDGQLRSVSTVSGADEDSADAVMFGILTRDDVGPINYQPPESAGFVIRYPIENYGFDEGDQGWVLSSAAQITNALDEVFARGASAKFDAAGRVAQTLDIQANTNYTLSAFVEGDIDLGVILDGQESSSNSDNSSYRFERHSFNSGVNTSVTIFAELAGGAEAFVDEFRLVSHPEL